MYNKKKTTVLLLDSFVILNNFSTCHIEYLYSIPSFSTQSPDFYLLAQISQICYAFFTNEAKRNQGFFCCLYIVSLYFEIIILICVVCIVKYIITLFRYILSPIISS